MTPKRCLKYDSTRNFHYQIDKHLNDLIKDTGQKGVSSVFIPVSNLHLEIYCKLQYAKNPIIFIMLLIALFFPVAMVSANYLKAYLDRFVL